MELHCKRRAKQSLEFGSRILSGKCFCDVVQINIAISKINTLLKPFSSLLVCWYQTLINGLRYKQHYEYKYLYSWCSMEKLGPLSHISKGFNKILEVFKIVFFYFYSDPVWFVGSYKFHKNKAYFCISIGCKECVKTWTIPAK